MDSKVRHAKSGVSVYNLRQNGPRPTPSEPQNPNMPASSIVAVGALEDLDEGAGYYLLPKDIVDQDLSVQIKWWPAVRAGQVLRIRWNGAINPGLITVTPADAADPNKVWDFTVPAATMAGSVHGQYALQFTVGQPPTGNLNPSFSKAITIIVDREAPGGELKPQLQWVSNISDGITESDLDAGGNLEAIVADYYNMKIEDVVTPWIGTADGSSGEYITSAEKIVGFDEVGTQRVHILFPRNLLEKYGDGPVAFSYTLRDRAGNEAVTRAPDYLISVLLRDAPDDFLAPLVPSFDDGLITDTDARVPVTVSIPAYTNAKAGDIITVFWGAAPLGARVLQPGEELLDPLVTDISVRYSQLLPAGSETGSVDVTYTVTRGINVFPRSPATTVIIDLSIPGGPDPDPETPENENLLPPTVTSDSGAGQEGTIPEDDYEKDAQVTIPWQTVDGRQAMAADDQLFVFWQATRVINLRLSASQVTRNLNLTIATNYIQAEGAGLKDVTYSLTRALSTAPHTSTALSPKSQVLVESDVGLPGDGSLLAKPDLTEAYEEEGFRIIDRAAGYDGTPVVCPLTDTNINAFDTIQLFFIGYGSFDGTGAPIETSRYEPSRSITAAEIAAQQAIFDVPASIMRALCVGSVKPTYKVTNNLGTTESAPADVVVVQMSDGGDPSCSLN
jgi:hypothetical protein